jgi:hypothetical protein
MTPGSKRLHCKFWGANWGCLLTAQPSFMQNLRVRESSIRGHARKPCFDDYLWQQGRRAVKQNFKLQVRNCTDPTTTLDRKRVCWFSSRARAYVCTYYWLAKKRQEQQQQTVVDAEEDNNCTSSYHQQLLFPRSRGS